MTAYVALLRAVNVGGTGALSMTELKAMCEAAGFGQVRTYIASGNVVFTSALGEAEVRAALAHRLEAFGGQPIGVVVRTAAEMADIKAHNPFPDKPGNQVVAIFIDAPLSADMLLAAKNVRGEQMRLGDRAFYVFYNEGQANSRLTIPAAKTGTARNMNTVGKLAELAAGLAN